MEEEQSEIKFQMSEEIKWGIINAIKYFKQTYSKVQEIFNLSSKGTISKIWQKYQKTGNVANQYYNNQNALKHSETIKDNIETVVSSFKQQKFTLYQIQQVLLNKYDIEISKAALSAQMQKLEYKYGTSRFVHSLTKQNKSERVRYCKQFLRKRLDSVIFSDESIFSLKENGVKLRHKTTQEKYIKKKEQQYINRSIHVWGCISLLGKSKLFIHSNKVNSKEYIKCIQHSFLPFKKKFHANKECFLLQDGAPSHKSRETKEFFKQKQINHIQNPQWSPDLNPIKLIWAHMKNSFKKFNISNNMNSKEELIEVVKDIWENIPQTLIDKIINHTKNKMKKIKGTSGDYIL